MKTKTKTYRLMPELVPRPLWGISAPRALKKSTAWKVIREETIAEAGGRCQFCDTDTQPECHDKWKYDDKKCVATLVGFEIRCKACHFATHIGRAMTLGPAYLQEAVEQICKVNGCTVKNVDDILSVEMPLWEKRNKKKWTVVVAPPLLKRYPRLEAIPLM
jgi:hypothetical protein